MLNGITNNNYFHPYYKQWIIVYKEGAIRDVTMKKYQMALKWIEQLAPTPKLCEVNRITYQQLLNDYAIEHERVTTWIFTTNSKELSWMPLMMDLLNAIQLEKQSLKVRPLLQKSQNI